GAEGTEKFFRSGVLDAAGRLDPAADTLSLLILDHDGKHMDRRQPQDIHVPLYNNGIGPGAARVVHYRVAVPKDANGGIVLSSCRGISAGPRGRGRGWRSSLPTSRTGPSTARAPRSPRGGSRTPRSP